MIKKTITLEELRDSRILFEKNPPWFGFAILLIMALSFVTGVIWSIKTPKIYTIKAQGVVTNEEANYVMSSYTGEVTNCTLVEGMLVEEGDNLFSIKGTEYDIQEEQLLLNKDIFETQIQKYELLVQSIKDDTNYFDEKNAEDELYYSIYERHLRSLETISSLLIELLGCLNRWSMMDVDDFLKILETS